MSFEGWRSETAAAHTQSQRSFKNYCKQSFVDDLNSVPWNVIEAAISYPEYARSQVRCWDGHTLGTRLLKRLIRLTISDAVSLWEHLFCSVADQHAPIKKKTFERFFFPVDDR
jgi:hypothetical protein